MAAIPVWAVGQNCAFTITPQTVAANGTLSDNGSAVTLTGHLSEASIESTVDLVELSPMDATRRNMVPTTVGTRVDLTELVKKNGTNLLANQAYTSSYFKVVITRGAQAFTFYGTLASYGENYSRERVPGRFALDMVDPGVSNPAYS